MFKFYFVMMLPVIRCSIYMKFAMRVHVFLLLSDAVCTYLRPSLDMKVSIYAAMLCSFFSLLLDYICMVVAVNCKFVYSLDPSKVDASVFMMGR